jgi:hypothetical protein
LSSCEQRSHDDITRSTLPLNGYIRVIAYVKFVAIEAFDHYPHEGYAHHGRVSRRRSTPLKLSGISNEI